MANKKNNKNDFVNAMKAKGIQYFDLGGGVTNSLAPQSTTQSSNVGGGLQSANPFANTPVLNGGPTSQIAGGVISGVGGLAQGIGGAFTAQNQFQANLAPTTQLNYAPAANQALAQSNAGYGQLQGNIANQQSLEQQLINQGNGQGPNPAQAALNQNTGQNIQNQAALMASQRGASSNPALIARQAAQQGAATQQNAVGQSATLQAQQQLASQQGAAALQGQIGNQITGEQAAQNQVFGTSVGANNTQNANLVSNYGMAQGLNQQTSQNNANAVNQTTSGVLGGISSLASLLAEGGEVKPIPEQPQQDPAASISQGFNSAVGSEGISNAAKNVKNYAAGGPVSFAGQFINNSPSQGQFAVGNTGDVAPAFHATNEQGVGLKMPSMPGGSKDSSSSSNSNDSSSDQVIVGGQGEGPAPESMYASKGGKVPAMVSPGEKYLPPKAVKEVKQGKKSPMEAGETIKGKAKVAGNSLKNDTVPKTLESGGIVLPRSVTQAKDAPRKAAAFVQAIQSKQGLKRAKRG